MRITGFVAHVIKEFDDCADVLFFETTHLPTDEDTDNDSDSEDEADLSGGEESDDDGIPAQKKSKEKKKVAEKAKQYWMNNIVKKDARYTIRGRFASYSRFVFYDLDVGLPYPTAAIYSINHIHAIFAPRAISLRRIRYVVKKCLVEEDLKGNMFITKIEQKQLKKFWEYRDPRTRTFVSLKGRGDFKTLDQLKEFFAQNYNLQRCAEIFRLLDNVFMTPWYYKLFPFQQRRTLARVDDTLGALQKIYTRIVHNPLMAYLNISLTPQDTLFNTINDYALQALYRQPIDSTIVHARLWVDATTKLMHQYGSTRFPIPESKEVTDLLVKCQVIELDSDQSTWCRLWCTTQAVRIITERLKQHGVNSCKILFVNESALGDQEMTEFVEGTGLESEPVSATLVVSATPYSRRDIHMRGCLTANIYALSTLLKLEKSGIDGRLPEWRRKPYTKLLLHASEQMGLAQILELLDSDTRFKRFLIVVDMNRVSGPTTTSLGAGPITRTSSSEGIGNWVQDLLNSGDFAVAQAEIDERALVAAARPPMIRTNLNAVIHHAFREMKMSRSLVQADYKSITPNPGVFFLTRDEFLRLARAGGLPGGFNRQILVECRDDYDVTMTAIYPNIYGDEAEEGVSRDVPRLFRGQLLRKPGHTAVFYLDMLAKPQGAGLREVEHVSRNCTGMHARILIEIPGQDPKVVENYTFTPEDRLRTVDCDYISACPRSGVQTVFYLVHPRKSYANSLYTALAMAKTQCVFVGELADIQAAISRIDSDTARLRTSTNPQPLQSLIAPAVRDEFENQEAPEQPLPPEQQRDDVVMEIKEPAPAPPPPAPAEQQQPAEGLGLGLENDPELKADRKEADAGRSRLLDPIGRPPDLRPKKKRKRRGQETDDEDDDDDDEDEDEDEDEDQSVSAYVSHRSKRGRQS